LPSLLVLLPVLALQSQQLTATELSLGVAASFARETFLGGELGLGRRTSNETRIAVAVAAGSMAREPAARAQLTVQLLVNPAARTGGGVAMYAGLGAAFAARRGAPGQALVAVLLGVEHTPGSPNGWFVEAGFAGGVRAAAGWRLRWFPDWWGRA
jgi:hypothetical protein